MVRYTTSCQSTGVRCRNECAVCCQRVSARSVSRRRADGSDITARTRLPTARGRCPIEVISSVPGFMAPRSFAAPRHAGQAPHAASGW